MRCEGGITKAVSPPRELEVIWAEMFDDRRALLMIPFGIVGVPKIVFFVC